MLYCPFKTHSEFTTEHLKCRNTCGLPTLNAVLALCSQCETKHFPPLLLLISLSFLSTAVHEGTLVHTLSMLSLWCAKFNSVVPQKLIDWFQKGMTLKQSTSVVRNGYIQCMLAAFKGQFCPLSGLSRALYSPDLPIDETILSKTSLSPQWTALFSSDLILPRSGGQYFFMTLYCPTVDWRALFPDLILSHSGEDNFLLILYCPTEEGIIFF